MPRMTLEYRAACLEEGAVDRKLTEVFQRIQAAPWDYTAQYEFNSLVGYLDAAIHASVQALYDGEA